MITTKFVMLYFPLIISAAHNDRAFKLYRVYTEEKYDKLLNT